MPERQSGKAIHTMIMCVYDLACSFRSNFGDLLATCFMYSVVLLIDFVAVLLYQQCRKCLKNNNIYDFVLMHFNLANGSFVVFAVVYCSLWDQCFVIMETSIVERFSMECCSYSGCRNKSKICTRCSPELS